MKTAKRLAGHLSVPMLQWLQNSPCTMTLIAADIWDQHAENWVFQMAREPASWILDMEPVMALQAPLRKYGIYNLALHNLREFRDRVFLYACGSPRFTAT